MKSLDLKNNQMIDMPLLILVLALLSVGFIVMTSASISLGQEHYESPFYYSLRQALYVSLGLILAFVAYLLPLNMWRSLGPLLLAVGLLSLAVVLLPIVGKTVNGSSRWLQLGVVNIQVSEPVKLILIVYLAGYVARHTKRIRSENSGFIMPMLLLSVFAFLLLLQPDFGAVAVIIATALGLLMLAGARKVAIFVVSGAALGTLSLLAIMSPYRLKRLAGFINPFDDALDSGFQLTQALIAFGRGEWLGVGLGEGVQKLFYLPESHTDFVLAVLAEELGLVGVTLIIVLFLLLSLRCMQIGKRAEQNGNIFGAYIGYGVGLWIALQSFVNMGVNMGMLPTKGITLPLISYGGSSLVVSIVALALVMRVHKETTKLVNADLSPGVS